MEYIKGKPYFCFSEEKIKQYPYLEKDLYCDILIVGGGIDGAIANYYLSQNHNVALVDKSRFGMSCTSCATALLEYQLDEFADDLKDYLTDSEISLAYDLGKKSIRKMQKFIAKHGNFCHFLQKPTFLYSKTKKASKDILSEYEFRKAHNFDCKLIEKNNKLFPFDIENGILAEDGGAEFNPYLFEKQMIENSKNQNQIFENTKIEKLEKITQGYIASTNFGEKIYCKKIVIATGFNWELLQRTDLCERFTSYSVVTAPIKNISWYKNALVHDCEEPYHYMRILPDKRIIFGGEDTLLKQKSVSEKLANKKYDKLKKDLKKLLKNENLQVDYKFCGAFGTTNNNMGLIGESKFDDDILLFISCGANGIINAMIGVEVLEDILNKKTNEYAKVFDPKREVW